MNHKFDIAEIEIYEFITVDIITQSTGGNDETDNPFLLDGDGDGFVDGWY